MRKKIILLVKLLNSLNKLENLLIAIGIFLSFFLITISGIYFYKIITASQVKYQGVLKEGVYQNINTLNPFLAENQTEKTLINLIYDSLIRPNGLGDYELELAKEITQLEKGLKYEVTLKEAYWSNGERINANDVIETFNYLKAFSSQPLGNYFKNITLEKIDNYKILFKLPVKDNFFLQKLSYVKIIPAKIWLKYEPSEWQTKEEEIIKVSSGPFVFYRKHNNIYEFVRNPFYKPFPHLEKVIIKIYPDTKEAYQALKVKEINAIGGLMPIILENNLSKTLRLEKIILPRIIAIFFNSEKVNSQEVENFKKIIKREDLLKNLNISNYFEISDSIFSPSIKKILSLTNYNNQVVSEESKNDVNNLKFNFKLTVPDVYLMNKIALYFQNQLGIKLENKSLNEINNIIIPQKNYEALIYGISYNLKPDLGIFFTSDSNFNLTNKQNQEIIKLIQEIEIGDKINSTTLAQLEKEINKMPIVFLLNPYYIYVLPKNLSNFNAWYLNDPSEKFVKIEEWYLK